MCAWPQVNRPPIAVLGDCLRGIETDPSSHDYRCVRLSEDDLPRKVLYSWLGQDRWVYRACWLRFPLVDSGAGRDEPGESGN
jgi:hypothetical protein